MATITEQAWEAFHTSLHQFIRSRVADEATAEDLLQEVFLKIHQQGASLRDARHLESWIYQITRNLIIDYYRSRQHRSTPLDTVEVLDLPEELPDDDIVSALLPCVRAMVLALPDQDRQALILTEYQGLTQKELGERLGLSFSGAKSRVQRGSGPSEAAEAQPVSVEPSSSCSASSCCTNNAGNPITSELYTPMELGEIPLAAALASLGCGNPTALAELKPGEKVLDLGSGGGIDVLLSAKRVGPAGFACGLDMTDPMLELAERNRQEAGIENVRFLKGIIEAIPLPENSVDVIISNCVINLSADKGQVLREAYRVLTPGGRFAVSDIVVQGALPPALRRDMESWAGCVAGALEEDTYRSLLRDAGFVDIEIEVIRRYSLYEVDQSGTSASVTTLSPEERTCAVDGRFISAFVRARKPGKP